MGDGPVCSIADLCDELQGAQATAFASVYGGDPETRTIFRSENFALLADMSPMMLGHLLLLPIRHYLSFGQVVGAMPGEVEGLIDGVVHQYERTFGPMVVLEHGSSSAMAAGACISHAHWHLVPLGGREVQEVLRRDGLVAKAIAGIGELADLGRKDLPYFYCGYSGRHAVYECEGGVRRQYLRSVMARLLNIPDPLWDYALVTRRDLLRETMRLTSTWRW
jgi:diadenosine tetraphosphate (Ap4A) HIT family hydrolase